MKWDSRYVTAPSWLTARKPIFLSDRAPLPFTKAGMESVLIAALLAASPSAPPAEATASAGLDLRCFRLMAELAEDEDPRVRASGRIAAQYFLGRIDAAQPGADLGAAAVPVGEARERLLTQCGNALERGGRDFHNIGETLAAPSRPTV
jgi:hypothetical protein